MLSFMRERELEDLPVQGEAGSGESQIADGESRESNGAGEEYLSVAARNENVRKSTILLAVLFVTGLLCLWFMIKSSTPQEAAGGVISTEESRIEQAIARLTGVRSEMFNRMDEIVKKFYEFSDVQQVQVNELVKNPFEHEIFLGNVEEISDNKGGQSEDIRQKAESMQLMSLMQSEQGNSCMIDDMVLYEGDTINGFKVSQISDSFVKLVPLVLGTPYGEPQEESLTERTGIILKLLE